MRLSVLLVLLLLLVCLVSNSKQTTNSTCNTNLQQTTNSTCNNLQQTTNSTCNTNLQQTAKTVLNVLVTAPYPPSDGGWDGGLALISGVRLALRQINQHPNILPGYTLKAVEHNSGCQVTSTASISFVQSILYSGLNYVGIIGPGCSAATIELAPILSRPDISMIQIAPTATSPLIQELGAHTTFTMNAPLQMVSNTVDLLKRNNWGRFALLYDSSRTIFRTLRDAVVRQAKDNDINVGYDAFVSDYVSTAYSESVEAYFPFKELRESRSRVIVLVMETRTAQRVMCVAYNMGMLFPTYQWIIPESALDGLVGGLQPFKANGVYYNCSRQEMLSVLNGTIITSYTLSQPPNKTISPLNIPYHKYRELFNEEFQCVLNEPNIKELIRASNQTTEYFTRDDNWENPYYDATWVFGMALHQLASKGHNLSTYRYGQPDFTSALIDEFNNVKFQGASSLVEFTPNRTVSSTIITYNLTSANLSEIQSHQLCAHNGTLSCIADTTVIQDSFQEAPQRMHLSVGLLVIVSALAIALFMAALQILIVLYSERQSVKATSPNLSHLIFSGCYLYCIATVLYTLQQILPFSDRVVVYSILCNAVMWCVVVGASLIFGTILVKVWRVFRIFRHFRNERPGLLLTDQALVLIVLFLVVVDSVFCVCWNTIDPYFMQTEPLQLQNADVDIITVNLHCECTNAYVWIGIVLGLKGPIIILVVIFATLNRKIQRKHFSHTKKVNVLVYSLTVVCGAGFPLFFVLLQLSDSVYVSLIFCCILLLCVVVCCVLLFIPPLLNSTDSTKRRSTSSRASRSTIYYKAQHS